MKPFILILASFLIGSLAGYSQCNMPFPSRGVNLCLQGQPNIANTASTITIPNPTVVPNTGSYTVTFNYFSRTTGRCSGIITCAGATISPSGAGFVINLGTCTNLPANFYLSPSMQINMVSNTGGTNYFFLYVNRDCGFPLPIDIAYFNIESVANGEVTLVWATNSEVNASHFIVERNSTVDGAETDLPIGRVEAVSPMGGFYRFTDRYALNGFNAYHLKMVDLDGSFDGTKYAYTVCTNCTNTPPPVDCSTSELVGPTAICSGSRSIGVTNLPFYSYPTWSVSSDAATVSSTIGQSTNLTQVGNEVVTVTATLTGCTPQTQVKTKDIKMGTAIHGYIEDIFSTQQIPLYTDGRNQYVPRGVWTVTIDDPDPAVSLPTWQLLQGQLGYWQWNSITNKLEFQFPLTGHGIAIFQMDVQTACGPATNTFTLLEYTPPPNPFYQLSPNPVVSTLNLSVDERKLADQKITPSSKHAVQQVRVHDKNGTLVLHQKFPVNTKKVSLNVAGLKPDVYSVRVFNGEEWTTIKFIKQ